MIRKEIPIPFNSEYPVVDNEISNDLASVNWDYEQADIICCGVLYKNKMIILFREKDDDIEDYKKELINLLDNLLDNEATFYFAFNREMEDGNFKGFLKKEYHIGEIQAFHGKGMSKEFFFRDLKKDGLINVSEELYYDPIENHSEMVMECYEKGEYEKIIQHNVSDLIKQYFLIKHKDRLLEKYKNDIDGNKWLKKTSQLYIDITNARKK